LNRHGAVLVEFAIVVPIVFILFFAAIEFSRVAMIRHTVDNAVYEGARAAIVPGATALDAQNETRRVLASVDIVLPSVVVTPARIDANTSEVTVRVTVPLNANSFVPPQFFAGRSITRELTLRREGIR